MSSAEGNALEWALALLHAHATTQAANHVLYRIQANTAPGHLGDRIAHAEARQEQEGQHVVAEVVRVHRAAQLVGDGPEGLAQFLFFELSHGVPTVTASGCRGNKSGLKG